MAIKTQKTIRKHQDKQDLIKDIIDCEYGSTVYITDKKPLKSYDQIKYLHAIWKVLQNDKGYTPIEWEYFFKKKFGVMISVKDPITNEVNEDYKGFSKYTKAQMTEFIEQVRDFSDKIMGLYIATPDEWRQSKYIEYLEK